MALPVEEQNLVWGLTPAQLSTDGTFVWQYMADNSDIEWSNETGAVDISAAIGGSLTPEQVDAALVELRDKGLITDVTFRVASPSAP